MTDTRVPTDIPPVEGWAGSDVEVVKFSWVRAGDTLVFSDGRRLVTRSEHGATALFLLVQCIRFMGDDADAPDHLFPWDDFVHRVIR